MLPQVENHTTSYLCPATIMVLQSMFSKYTRLVLKHDFSAMGYSGSWVYLIHPFKTSAGYELPVVVKIASTSLIEKEWYAYKGYIRHNLLGIADLRDDPTFLEEQKLAGLCYQLIGGNVFKPQSLHKYCLNRHTSIHDIRFVLKNRLFQMIKRRIINPSIPKFDYPLQAIYDMVLPVNLLLSPEAIPTNETFTSISPSHLPKALLEEGSYVRLEGFVIKKVDLRDQTITLNLPSGQFARSYRVRIQSVEGLETARFNQQLPTFEGVVVETATTRFAAEVAKIGINDPKSRMITLPDNRQVANPLLTIPKILSKTRHLKFNTVHGDLNLENILIDPAIRDISLIDFSEARYGYVLHDLLHLEMEVMTKLLPNAFSEAHLPPEFVLDFYQMLDHVILNSGNQPPLNSLPTPLEKPFMILKEIRLVAREGLYDRQDFTEYYDGLLLYLLGAMRFANLDHDVKKTDFYHTPLNPKTLVFYAAIGIHKLMHTQVTTEAKIKVKNGVGIQKVKGENGKREERIKGEKVKKEKTKFGGIIEGKIEKTKELWVKLFSFDYFNLSPKDSIVFVGANFPFLGLDLKQQLRQIGWLIYLVTFILAFALLAFLMNS